MPLEGCTRCTYCYSKLDKPVVGHTSRICKCVNPDSPQNEFVPILERVNYKPAWCPLVSSTGSITCSK
jgi:hypothetical protein